MGLKFQRPIYRTPQLKTCRVGHKYKWLHGARVCECDFSASDLYILEGIKK